MSTPENLRALVLDRYCSVHAFCVAHPELKRSTVYMVLGGRYPGKAVPQLKKIQAVLLNAENKEPDASPRPLGLPPADGLAVILQNIRCRHCRLLDKKRCGGCRAQTLKEALELHTHLAGDT